jgi:hypothetical protein
LALASAKVFFFVSTAQAAELVPSDKEAIAKSIADGQEKFWQSIATADPQGTVSTRSLFTYALALCESRQHPERLERLFRLANRAQESDPSRSHYGNFKWSWRDSGVTDANAVEFCMHDALRIWRVHREWVPQPAQQILEDLMRLGASGSLRHRVRSSYTNMALLNAANLIGLGELRDMRERAISREQLRPLAIAEEGYHRLDAFYLNTWQFGVQEYCSPTYYNCDLSALYFIEANAQKVSAREQARALLRLFWTDITLNWFQPSDKFGGAQSRSYNYLYGFGGVDSQLWLNGWLPGKLPETSHLLTTMSARWSPPRELWDQATRQIPRLVRQRWGLELTETRTHWIASDVSLSAASACYGAQDLPLTIDLPGPREAARCYFIADGRKDPYGRIRYETSLARHMKALHLEPFWAAAQQTKDALGLVMYRSEDLKAPQVVNLHSDLVLRRPVSSPVSGDGIWLGGTKISLLAESGKELRQPIEMAQTIVLRHGTAAIGIRVLWARQEDGEPATLALVDDGNDYGVVRLTIQHLSEAEKGQAGAAIWIRVGSGQIDDAAFDAWRRRFEEAQPTQLEISPTTVRIVVPGEEGPVAIAADAPFGPGAVELTPRPLAGIFELNGRELGRPLLAEIEPARSCKRSIDQPINVPAGASLTLEAEDGLIFPDMVVEEDSKASGGRFLWQPQILGPSFGFEANELKAGEVYWPLEVVQAGAYFLWGRTSAADEKSDSFFVEVLDESHAIVPRAAWSVPVNSQWRWNPVKLSKPAGPTPLNLPAGRCYLHFLAREPGTKLDALFLTPNAEEQPKDK